VVHRVSNQVEKRLPQGVGDPSIELGIAGIHDDVDLFAEGRRKIPGMVREKPHERPKWLDLEAEQSVQLPFGQASENPLTSLEIETHLAKRGGQSSQHLLG
jgi:hypothetical protein